MNDLFEQGERLAASYGINKGPDLVSLARQLRGESVWMNGWYADEVSLSHQPGVKTLRLVGIHGDGVSRTESEFSVYMLFAWHLLPSDRRSEELDAWASAVLLSTGWRLVT